MSRFARGGSRLGLLAATLAIPFAAGGCELIFGIGSLPIDDDAGTPDTGTIDTAVPPERDTSTPACTPVSVVPPPARGAGACPQTVPGTCFPQDVTAFVPHWVPPVAREAQCTVAQVNGFVDACLGTASNPAGCDAFTEAAGNATCMGCLVTPADAPRYGAALPISPAGGYQPNVPGCIALAEPCNLPCAETYLGALVCAYLACDTSTNCPITDSASLTTQQMCVDTALTPTQPPCACSEWTPSLACINELSGPAVTECMRSADGGTEQIAVFAQLATFMCGPL